MIAAWMLLATLVASLLAVAAAATERVARAWGRPARVIWSVAMALSVALPAAAPFALRERAAARAPNGPARAGERAVGGGVRLPAIIVRASGAMQNRVAVLSPFDRPLVAIWTLASAAALLLLARGARDLARARRAWRTAAVDGIPVLLSDVAGPAVIGVRRPEIVLPEWALALDAPLRALVLRHEAEHRDARDPLHLALAAVAVALTPWNVALWWQARRLRTTIEIDCDARVLAAHGDVARYGLLLLAVAQQRATASWRLAGAPALAESSSDLSRRITAMRTPLPRHRALRTAGGLTIATVALTGAFAACSASRDVTSPQKVTTAEGRLATLLSADSSLIVVNGRTYRLVTGAATMPALYKTSSRSAPNDVRRLPAVVATAPADSGFARTPTVQDGPYFEFQVEQPVVPRPGSTGPRYPETLKSANVEGTVMAQFVVDTGGRVVPSTFKVLRSDHDLFTQAVKSALDSMQFRPAQVGGRNVKQLVEQPFQFQLSR